MGEVITRRSSKTCPNCGNHIILAIADTDDGSTKVYRYECHTCSKVTDGWTQYWELLEDFRIYGWAYRVDEHFNKISEL